MEINKTFIVMEITVATIHFSSNGLLLIFLISKILFLVGLYFARHVMPHWCVCESV